MSANLLPVWHEIEYYLKAGVSVIPVRDTTDQNGIAKSPFGSWKQYQQTIIDKNTLFELMDVRYNTTAIGIVGGKVSGNLEIIDIDVKYCPGIDAKLFADLNNFYPALFAKLRRHGSPSGGAHLIYRCVEAIEGNQKLAGRLATAAELEANPKNKTYNFLETRGEGGYVVAPPALGYSVINNVDIPLITLAERNAIIELCRTYNELIKVENIYKPTVQDAQYYDTNPFEDYNFRVDPGTLMQQLGFEYSRQNNQFLWYTRPGKKSGVSISFNKSSRFFFCFTSSTDLEANKGYTPANLLCTLEMNGDKKKLYSYLVANGYGVIKAKTEQKLAKIAATNGTPLPANISPAAKSIHAAIAATLEAEQPHGIFYVDSLEHGVQIDRELLYRVADGLGFKLHDGRLIHIDGAYIDEVTNRFFFDTIKDYIKEEDANLYRDICNAYEIFIEKHGAFTISRLQILNEEIILKDTAGEAFKCYSNGILKITANEIVLLPSINKLIWRKNVQQRDYTAGTGGKYLEFIKLATDYAINADYIKSCIGYLAHEFKDETAAYIIVLTEQCENPKDGGGAGKNVFCELFKNVTSYISKPGSQVKYDEKFLQSWNFQKIFCLSDVPENFNYGFLKELASGAGLMKKLFKDESEVKSALMPKFLIQTNFSPKITDGGLRRRIRQIEFTDFFTKCGGIDVHFNAHFPNGWSAEDWAGFDTFTAEAVQHWLLNNRKITNSTLSASGWAKQFEITYGHIISHFIKENFKDWLAGEWLSNDEFKKQLDAYYSANSTPPNFRPSSHKISAALKAYCENSKVQYVGDISKKINGFVYKYKWFALDSSTPF